MSRTKIATWGPDGTDLIHPGRPEVRVRGAKGCRLPQGHIVTGEVVRPVSGPSERPYRVIPKGGRRNWLRTFAAERARALILPRIGR